MLANSSEFSTLVNLFHKGTKLAYSKGEFITRPGESNPGVLYIEEGLVKAYDITKYGEENLLIIRKTGELLGITAALTDQDYSVIYTALSPTTVWLIPNQTFLEFIKKNPSASLPVLDMVIDMYRIHSERIMTLEYRTVRERLVSFLLTTMHRFGKKVPEGVRLEVPLKQQDIASSINATRETASRALAELERKGLLKSEQSYITLLDEAALRHFL